MKNIFDKPKVIAIIGDVNSGKSNLIYYLIEELKKNFEFSLYSYGLKSDLGENKIYSIEELEQIKNSIIILDEFYSLIDLEDRKKRKLIEKTFRLINHNNNILVISGTSENFKKFISAKVDVIMFKKTTLADLINGSKIKRHCLDYRGQELGSSILDIPLGECLIFDGRYRNIKIPYKKEYDSKKENKAILENRSIFETRSKKSAKKVQRRS